MIEELLAADEAEAYENENEVDEDELAKEARLIKKLKKGKISRKQFESELGDDALDKEIEAITAEKYKKKEKGNQGDPKKRKRFKNFADSKKSKPGDHQKRRKLNPK